MNGILVYFFCITVLGLNLYLIKIYSEKWAKNKNDRYISSKFRLAFLAFGCASILSSYLILNEVYFKENKIDIIVILASTLLSAFLGIHGIYAFFSSLFLKTSSLYSWSKWLLNTRDYKLW
ncbi:hypothetical protein BST96_09460 [Oceanicoccus sagamiensis]|uniref:Uncharacterized protein n=1 Tax=Oceanicoccus sagamiensis TaxID=716816 RepID=A0A1X9N8E7_9GAMM|nr:hypothetical protein BST96_09460 [Oceanicoccus sagamiensis]